MRRPTSRGDAARKSGISRPLPSRTVHAAVMTHALLEATSGLVVFPGGCNIAGSCHAAAGCAVPAETGEPAARALAMPTAWEPHHRRGGEGVRPAQVLPCGPPGKGKLIAVLVRLLADRSAMLT